jgi:hypothetical protein
MAMGVVLMTVKRARQKIDLRMVMLLYHSE